jgi:hypothetical protein
MRLQLRRLGIGFLVFFLILGFSAATQTKSATVTVKVSFLHKLIDIDVRPFTLTTAAGSAVIFQNHTSSLSPIVIINGQTELYKEIQPGAQHSHIFKAAGEYPVTINASGDSTLMKVNVTAGTLPVSSPGAKAIVAMAEILLEPVTGEQLLAIANFGKGVANLSNWHLCSSLACTRLADMVLLPQSWVVVHLGVNSANTPTDIYIALPRLNRSGDELAIYNSDRLDNPLNMVDYVRWGTERAPRMSGAAVSAGLWTSGASLDVSRLVRGQVIRYDGTGRRVSDYALSPPTMVSSAGR